MASITSIKSFLTAALLLAVLAVSSPVQAEEQGLQSKSDLRLQKRSLSHKTEGEAITLASLTPVNLKKREMKTACKGGCSDEVRTIGKLPRHMRG